MKHTSSSGLMNMQSSVVQRIDNLAKNSRRHVSTSLSEWARLALETVQSVASAAPDWVNAAVQMKQAHGASHEDVAGAEELATGPLTTLRLLLLSAHSLNDISVHGVPRLREGVRIAHQNSGNDATSLVEIDVVPARGLFDPFIYHGHSATVRCTNPGGHSAFMENWRQECMTRPQRGGVTLVLGAGNVTGLSVADALCQVFEYGRSALVKLHPMHEPLADVLQQAVAPLVDAGLISFVVGGKDLAEQLLRAEDITHVHLTGGHQAFESVAAKTTKPLTCELGNVTPWFVLPGRYTTKQLYFQADLIAASIANNTSFNCIATKLVVTCRQWEQRNAFLDRISFRLQSLPRRPAWFPGSAETWEQASGQVLPHDGLLPCVFRKCVTGENDGSWNAREWFVPVADEVTLDATSTEDCCLKSMALARRLPGSLAASVTVPQFLSSWDAARANLLLEHLPFGVVAQNCWSAIAYSMGAVPWGGHSGGTRSEPKSGIGFVHDPFLFPLIHNSIVRGPLVSRIRPPWFPWHTRSNFIFHRMVDLYAAVGKNRSGVMPLLRMMPSVLRG